MVNAQTNPPASAVQDRCSIEASDPSIQVPKIDTKNIVIKDKEGKETLVNEPIDLKISNVMREGSSSNDGSAVTLGDRIRVSITNLSKARNKDNQFDYQQLVLQLNGYPLKGIHGNFVEPDQLVFPLTLQEESLNEWNAILGNALNRPVGK
ncbi:MAG: hypothetical protein ACK5ZE_08895 [Pseudanabaena sp.]|jgi:hypothetical protein